MIYTLPKSFWPSTILNCHFELTQFSWRSAYFPGFGTLDILKTMLGQLIIVYRYKNYAWSIHNSVSLFFAIKGTLRKYYEFWLSAIFWIALLTYLSIWTQHTLIIIKNYARPKNNCLLLKVFLHLHVNGPFSSNS